MIDTAEKLLTAVEVAGMLQVTRQAIYQWVHHRRIPCIRVGGSVRFRKSDIEDWLNANTQAPVE